MDKNIEILEKLRNLSIEERISFLKDSNITKTNVCDQLLNGDQFSKIPMKSMVIKMISNWDDQSFLRFVAENIDKVPDSLLNKLIK